MGWPEAEAYNEVFLTDGMVEAYPDYDKFLRKYRRLILGTLEDRLAEAAIALLGIAFRRCLGDPDRVEWRLDISDVWNCDPSFAALCDWVNCWTLHGLDDASLCLVPVRLLERWCTDRRIDLEWHVRARLAYMEHQPERIGTSII